MAHPDIARMRSQAAYDDTNPITPLTDVEIESLDIRIRFTHDGSKSASRHEVYVVGQNDVYHGHCRDKYAGIRFLSMPAWYGGDEIYDDSGIAPDKAWALYCVANYIGDKAHYFSADTVRRLHLTLQTLDERFKMEARELYKKHLMSSCNIEDHFITGGDDAAIKWLAEEAKHNKHAEEIVFALLVAKGRMISLKRSADHYSNLLYP